MSAGIRNAVIIALATAFASPASAQPREVEVDKSATRDLYIRKRPPVPESPRIPKRLLPLIAKKEKQRDGKRKEAIGLLEQFLRSKPTGAGRAEGLFKLAELLWEDARAEYVKDMTTYDRRVERCRQNPGKCKRPPKEPRLDFSRSEKLYRALLSDHPDFRRTDLVLYLVGFAAREGGRIEEALGYFQQVIDRYPESALYGDAWMMVGEHHFALGHWADARDAYKNILEHPEAKSYDLALFKTAWCYWKLNDTDTAAKLFKRVLDLAAEAERSGTAKERKRRAQLRDEALDYLVLVFTEDESITAKEVYEFLASIGGERYSRDVLVRLADLHFTEASYDRAKATFRFLIELDPAHLHAAKLQRQIVEADLAALEFEAALTEVKILTESYGPDSDWADANKDRAKALERSHATTERMVRVLGKNFHGEAQDDEKARGKPDLKMYKRAETTYGYYLEHFSKSKRSVETRYLRAEILKWKFGEQERAGDEYLIVGKTAPVGKYHKEALLKAMDSFEKARPKIKAGQRKELLPVDRKFAETVDLYVKLFPGDDQMVSVVFKNGQLFYDYGDYDEAVKRFGLIVTEFPNHENAGAAGDRILDALNKSEDYENIEHWARQLKKSKAFSSRAEQQRLDRIIVEAIGKSGEKYAAGGHYEKAAGFYLRIPKEYPKHKLAPQALFNAAVTLEKAKKPEDAARTYLLLTDRYPKNKKAQTSAFTAAKVYEDTAYFERAAETYEFVAKKFAKGKYGADSLYNAGVLRQALGQPRRAIKHYEKYAKRFKKRNDAADVAFRVGVVYEEADDDGRANRAFQAYAKRYRRGKHLVQAHTRAGRTAFRLGHTKRAASEFKAALKAFKGLKGEQRELNMAWAAEARYYEGELEFKKYAKISLNVKPRKLKRTLDKKSKTLESAMNVYLDVVEFGDPQWATAGLYRIGHIFEEFATAMQEAPPPPELNEQEQQVYRDQLDNYVINIEERAIELYTAGYQKALELKVYNKYTRLLRQALGRMAASQFPKENEAREGNRLADVPPQPALVKEVLRDD
jgi:TolA-binding protein